MPKNGKIVELGSFERCLSCQYLGKGCDGPRTNAMPMEQYCEWLRRLKLLRDYTNSYICEITYLSENTLDRIFSGAAGPDIRRSTLQTLENLLIGSPGSWPCAIDATQEKNVVYMDKPETLDALREAKEQADALRRHLDDFKSVMDKEVEIVRGEYKDTIDNLRIEVAFLRQQIERKDVIIEKLIDTKP